jgi:sphinganine-1-phosphate aldolase
MLDFLTKLLSTTVSTVDNTLEDIPAHQIILATAALYFLYNQYQNPWISRAFRTRHAETIQQRVLNMGYSLFEKIPYAHQLVDNTLNKELASVDAKIRQQRQDMSLQKSMPETGISPVEILKTFDINPYECAYDFASSHGRTSIVEEGDGQDSGALYTAPPQELTELLKEVYAKTAYTNPLHEKWPRIKAMQAEIIHWCLDLFHGTNDGYGVITHGGTTSIIEAMSAYVVHTREKGIAHPEIVVPATAHAAFKKAAELTGATLVIVPVNAVSGTVEPDVMGEYISANTAVIVGSAPSFMYGIADPIAKLGRLATYHQVPFHVDACLGGFLTAFLDTSNNPMDFRVPGVTSISADTHKYSYCPKGTSVILFSKNSPAMPYFTGLNWSGGLYTTPGMLDGSTSGARVAEIYTTMSYFGKSRYEQIANDIIELRESIQNKLSELIEKSSEISKEDIYIFGKPKGSVLGFQSKKLNPHIIADEMEKKGWKLSLLQNPDGFHLCLTQIHTLIERFAEQFTADLVNATLITKAYPKNQKPSGNVKTYGVIGFLPSPIQQKISEHYQRANLCLFDYPGQVAQSSTAIQLENCAAKSPDN